MGDRVSVFINIALQSNTRAVGDGPHSSELWLSDNVDTSEQSSYLPIIITPPTLSGERDEALGPGPVDPCLKTSLTRP
ncbi:hypothetical protein TNCV_3547361 [Trichonephila clavipes]|nr:hypothetical protein TNCV_3547361 [Trichonephila clavipes]